MVKNAPTAEDSSKAYAVRIDSDVVRAIKEAAAELAIPFSSFIRMAAKKEAERVLRRRAA